MIARGPLNEGEQPNLLMPNFDNARKLVQKELESECVCPNNCYRPFPEDEMYSIQLQIAELRKPEHGMHTCPHPASNICQTLNCSFSTVLVFLLFLNKERYIFHFTNVRNSSAWGRNYKIRSQACSFNGELLLPLFTR